MKYWLYTESQGQKPRAKGKREGIAVIVTDNFTHILRIENIALAKNLTPWLRRRDAAPVDLPYRLKQTTILRLSVDEMKKLLTQARQGQGYESVDVRVHEVGEVYVVHAERGGLVAARTLQAATSELRALLTRIKRKYRSIRLTVIAARLAPLKKIFDFDLGAAVFFVRERLAELNPRRGNAVIREVLILTNISGSPLPELDKNLEFWSKGLTGFRFRHIYGQLTRKRVEAVTGAREWDCLIYRGHGVARDGGICLSLADGEWKMPAFTSSIYMHLSCLPNAEELELDALPTARILTPLRHLPDFDDRRLVETFLERTRIAGSVEAAVRAVQTGYPEFVYISAGD